MCKVKIRASRNGKAVSHTWPDYDAQMPTQRNKIKTRRYTPMLTRKCQARDARPDRLPNSRLEIREQLRRLWLLLSCKSDYLDTARCQSV